MIRFIERRPLLAAVIGLVVVLLLVLSLVTFKDGQATLLGSALGAFIAVALAADMAAEAQRRESRLVVRYCAAIATDMASAVGKLREALESVGRETFQQSELDRVKAARADVQHAYSRAWLRLKRVQEVFFKMPEKAINTVSEIERLLGTLDLEVEKGVRGWSEADMLDVVGITPPSPGVLNSARRHQKEFGRIRDWLATLAEE